MLSSPFVRSSRPANVSRMLDLARGAGEGRRGAALGRVRGPAVGVSTVTELLVV